MGKKALAAISFGTTYPEARKAIAQIEQNLQSALPEYDFYRAFTSQMVIRKITREEGKHIPNPQELMQTLLAAGYDEVLCQSLHVIPGIEYDKMITQLAPYSAQFQKFAIGRPMLFEKMDYEFICRSLLDAMPPLQADEAFVYMGHGTEHFANAAYSQIENMFRFLDAERVYVGTVEGFPDLEYVRQRLKCHDVKKVRLAPFMIVAGDHAQNDLAGSENSWKCALKGDGYETQVQLRGLGECMEIGSLYVRHAQEALQA